MAKKSKLKSEDPSHQDEQVIDCKVVVLVDVIILIQSVRWDHAKVTIVLKLRKLIRMDFR